MHCSKCGQKDLKLIQSLCKIGWKGEGSKAQLRSSTAQTISSPGAEMFLASIPTNGLQIYRRHVESKLSTINMSSGVLICWYCWHLPLHSQHGAILDINIFAGMLTGEAKCHYNHQQWWVIIMVPLYFTQKCNFNPIASCSKSMSISRLWS